MVPWQFLPQVVGVRCRFDNVHCAKDAENFLSATTKKHLIESRNNLTKMFTALVGFEHSFVVIGLTTRVSQNRCEEKVRPFAK